MILENFIRRELARLGYFGVTIDEAIITANRIDLAKGWMTSDANKIPSVRRLSLMMSFEALCEEINQRNNGVEE